jgi:hypothetical protein
VVCLLRAVELAPGHVEALSSLGRFLLEAGAPADAIRLSEASHARDRSDMPLVTVARAHALLGDWGRVASTLDRMQTSTRNQIGIALTARFAMWRREPSTVKALFDQIHALGSTKEARSYRLMFVIGEAVLEGRSPRVGAVDRTDELGPSATRSRRAFVHQLDAEADAYLGIYGDALTSIEAAIEAGLYDALWMDRCPLFDDLRGSARFEAAREVVQGRARRVLALLNARPVEV